MDNKKRTIPVRKLTLTGMVIAISIILSTTFIGTIPIPPSAEITIGHLPTIILAILEGPIYGLFSGLILGIISMCVNLFAPKSPLAPFFAHPLVSILPRMLIGVTSYFVYTGLKNLLPKNNKGLIASVASGAAAGSLTNTVFVLLFLYIVYAKDILAMLAEYNIAGTVVAFLVGIGTLNGLLEMLAAIVIVTAVVMALRKAGFNSK